MKQYTSWLAVFYGALMMALSAFVLILLWLVVSIKKPAEQI